MSSRKDGAKIKTFCQKLKAQLEDETMANTDYAKDATETRKLNHPASEMIAAIYDMLSVQEGSHKEALKKIQKEVCPI